MKHLVDNFDYTFFITANDVEIKIESEDVIGLEVFGTPDYKEFN